MNNYNRPAWQSAVVIQAILQQKCLTTVVLPEQLWQEAEQLLGKINKADQRGWHNAARRLRERYLQLLARLRSRISDMENEIQSAMQPTYLAPLRTIYNELCSLEEEFDDIDISLSCKQVRCTTDDIELEGIQLGRFSIALNWSEINEPQPYQVEALDPNLAASSDCTTHPHVQNYRLCEGEGHAAIQAALRQGRLCDFFILVRQILETYNPDSPYVSLNNWFGVNCRDCGYLMEGDENYYCERCDSTLCPDCSCCCNICYETLCNECSRTCEACLNSCCPGCINQCATCDDYFCNSCEENFDNEICKTCLEGNRSHPGGQFWGAFVLKV